MEMPDGIMMFAPTKIGPMATTKLYSWPAKFRMALDLVIPVKEKWPEGETAQQHDESVESLVVRRMGRESLERLAEPLVGGVNGTARSYAASSPSARRSRRCAGSIPPSRAPSRGRSSALSSTGCSTSPISSWARSWAAIVV